MKDCCKKWTKREVATYHEQLGWGYKLFANFCPECGTRITELVECRKCRFNKLGVGSYCIHPYNVGFVNRIRKLHLLRKPRIINKEGDCKWFENKNNLIKQKPLPTGEYAERREDG
jgi:hypothetical protein